MESFPLPLSRGGGAGDRDVLYTRRAKKIEGDVSQPITNKLTQPKSNIAKPYPMVQETYDYTCSWETSITAYVKHADSRMYSICEHFLIARMYYW